MFSFIPFFGIIEKKQQSQFEEIFYYLRKIGSKSISRQGCQKPNYKNCQKMKKILSLYFVFFFFVLSAQSHDSQCWKMTKSGATEHCLSFRSKEVVHMFDALPKYRLYQYSGSKFGSDSEIKEMGNNRFFYPTYQNTREEYEIEVYIPTYNDKYMVVTLLDLDAMDQKNQREMQKLQNESNELAQKMGYPKTELKFTPTKPLLLNNHNTMYNVAFVTNLNYNSDEKGGLRPFEFPNFQKGYVGFSEHDHSGYYTAIIKNRYIIKIKLTEIHTLKDCSSVENYLTEYLSKFNFLVLPPSK
ncbi:MAG: hypothetical protein C4K58_06595 [Flavobacteriaceae bacterium]|nr:MAG: hypothetical protein C4K58_06595 [Flavobacteriaceae bacterium]